MSDNKGNEFAKFMAEAKAHDPDGFASAERAELEALRKAAERYRKLRSADMDTRNRLEHYSDSALDVMLDALPAVGAA